MTGLKKIRKRNRKKEKKERKKKEKKEAILVELWYTFDPIKIRPLVLIHFWYTQKCIKYTLTHSKAYQIMIGDRKSYLNYMKCVWNDVKMAMYQKHFQSVFIPLSNFYRLKSVSEFSQGTHWGIIEYKGGCTCNWDKPTKKGSLGRSMFEIGSVPRHMKRFRHGCEPGPAFPTWKSQHHPRVNSIFQIELLFWSRSNFDFDRMVCIKVMLVW